jgi:predicted RecA/RadA family phage recombinase
MAKNKIQDGKLLNLPVIAGTVSGMGAVVGSYLHGVAQTDRDAAGYAVLDCGPAVYDLPVYPWDGSGASAVTVGDALYWDTALTPDNLDKNAAGVFFGFALEAIAASPLALSTINVMVMHVQPGVGAVTEADIGSGAVTATKIGALAVLTAAIQNANVTLAKLASGITPSHVVKFAGNTAVYATSPASANFAVTGLTGLLSTDIVIATIKTNGATVKNLISYAMSGSPLDTVTFTGSAAFVAGDIISYMILRAAA